MEITEIMYLVTAIVTFVLGIVSKKSKWVSNHIIPLQNLAIGIISAVIYYIMTKDINLVLVAVPLFTGGTYDVFNNIKKLINE